MWAICLTRYIVNLIFFKFNSEFFNKIVIISILLSESFAFIAHVDISGSIAIEILTFTAIVLDLVTDKWFLTTIKDRNGMVPDIIKRRKVNLYIILRLILTMSMLPLVIITVSLAKGILCIIGLSTFLVSLVVTNWS